jgi:hypothetical protein
MGYSLATECSQRQFGFQDSWFEKGTPPDDRPGAQFPRYIAGILQAVFRSWRKNPANVSVFSSVTVVSNISVSNTIEVVTGGVNYNRFNWGSPVVAKY